MKHLLACSVALLALAAAAKDYTATSPDGRISVTVSAGKDLTWSVSADGNTVLSPSPIQLTLTDGTAFGINPKVKKARVSSVKNVIGTPIYKRASVDDNYTLLDMTMADGYGLQVRVYDDGAAYRFVTNRKGSLDIADETATFRFPADFKAFVPYVNDNRGGERYTFSFESYYDEQPLSAMYPDSLAITPLLVDEGDYKVVISDFGISDYPGMFLKSDGNGGLVSEFAKVPVEGFLGGYNELNFIPTDRAPYIAGGVKGKREYPWRAVIVARDDTELPGNDMAVRLSPPCRLDDISWIQPGLVAWDWWNARHITGVDFLAGINDPTYRYFVDFAADNGIPYIIVDEGWSDENSLIKTRGNVDIPALVEYARDKNVGVILWASWKNMHRELEEAMRLYSDMGVAGFKIDFFDADDQNMINDMAIFADEAAKHHLVLDYHGMKANGMQVTYPNILNFEGVKGLENYKWSSIENNAPGYAVSAPYIRMIAGPMDYTPGAMINANRSQHRADNDNPMSEGTRVNQLAMYIVFDAPLQMLADSPVRYEASPKCLDLITSIPTVFDETKILEGSVGEYIVTARRSGDTWYVGAMTNRTPRDIDIELSFLPEGSYTLNMAEDGINYAIDASDHVHSSAIMNSGDTLRFSMAPAGGWVGVFTPVTE